MSFSIVGFLGFLFVGMTIMNRILEGAFIAASEVGILNTLTITNDQRIFNLFTIPVINPDFFFTGIPRLIKWDYSFFGGNAAMIQYLMYSITFAVAFGLLIIIIGVVSNLFARRI